MHCIKNLLQSIVVTTKKSQANARKAIGEVKKLITEYRQASVSETK